VSNRSAFICTLPLVLSTTIIASPQAAAVAERAPSDNSQYIVDGLSLGGHVQINSDAYGQYHCTPSAKFPTLTWCHKEKTTRTRREEVTVSTSIMHTEDGTVVYVNHYAKPAFFGRDDVRTEIERLSAKFGQSAGQFRISARNGLPDAIIAVWGSVGLEPLGPDDVAAIAAGGTAKGLLVSFLGDLQRSAKAGVPVYNLTGGPGFVWAATYNQDGRGVLRFFAIDASQLDQSSHNTVSAPPVDEPAHNTVSLPPTGYDESWYISSFWSGEYPSGFSVIKHNTFLLGRSGMDKSLSRSIECEMPYRAVIHPWNEERIKESSPAIFFGIEDS
jgi:hypothetical protein